MSRFYVPPGNINFKKKEITVTGEEARHIVDVMRMKESDKVVIFDGTGNEHTGFIEKIGSGVRTVIVRIIKTSQPDERRVPEVHLAQAIPRKNKMDNIVEKSTELGARCIIPFVSDRTIVRPDKASADRKVSRWKTIAKEASKQSGRSDIPAISEVKRFEDVLRTFDEYDIVLFAWLSEGTVPFKDSLSDFRTGKILVVIGPEGDFTPDEASRAVTENCRFVSLGQRVLKSDTAGLFMLSVLSYEFGV